MKNVPATEAKAKFSELLDEVERGERVEITRRGRVIARLIPAEEASESDKKRAFAEIRALRERLPRIPQAELFAALREGRE
jgi:prevent-host-death family protein